MAVLIVAIVLAFIGSPAAPGHVQPNLMLDLTDSTGATAGFVNVGMNAEHVLRIEPSLKDLVPETTYDVWLISCSGGPGGHPCPIGPLDGTDSIGTAGSGFGCVEVSPGTAGPLATETTNPAGNANRGAILIDLSGVAAGTYFFHVDVGPAAACHPDGGAPLGFFFTAGFSITI